MVWSLLNSVIADDVTALIDKANVGNESRQDMEHRALSREQTQSIIHAALWANASRASDTAACYALDALRSAIGRDLAKWCVAMFEAEDAASPLTPGEKP